MGASPRWLSCPGSWVVGPVGGGESIGLPGRQVGAGPTADVIRAAVPTPQCRGGSGSALEATLKPRSPCPAELGLPTHRGSRDARDTTDKGDRGSLLQRLSVNEAPGPATSQSPFLWGRWPQQWGRKSHATGSPRWHLSTAGRARILPSPSPIIWHCHFLCLPPIPGSFLVRCWTDARPQAAHPEPANSCAEEGRAA